MPPEFVARLMLRIVIRKLKAVACERSRAMDRCPREAYRYSKFLSGSANSHAGRVFVDRETIHIHDFLREVAFGLFPSGSRAPRRGFYRTMLGTPLFREGIPIGVMGIRRLRGSPFY